MVFPFCTFVDLTIRETDDPRTRAVLFRCKLQTSATSRAMTRAELRLPEMRARIRVSLPVALTGTTTATTATTQIAVCDAARGVE